MDVGREPQGPAPAAAAPDTAAATPAPAAPLSRLYVFAAIVVTVVVLDHLTKWLVIQHLPFNRDIQILGEWVMLTHIKNTGGAFGLFPGSILPLIGVSSVASVILCVLAVRLRHDWLRLSALGLILGGAIGNLIDRIVAQKVTDFIHVGIPGGPRWPIFNVADSAVSVGVAILAFLVYFRGQKDESAPAESPAPADAAAPADPGMASPVTDPAPAHTDPDTGSRAVSGQPG